MKIIKVSIFKNPDKPSKDNEMDDVRKKLLELGIEITESIDNCDIVIAMGGDGTILHVAIKAAFLNKPVLGVNFGRLGFISSMDRDELYLLERIANKDYDIEKRVMIKVNINDDTFFALNDVVISKGVLSRIIEIDVFSNERIVSRYRSDGIIIATPTGSTAYSLSAGGPVVDPKVSCILLTPVCPHMKFTYPIVFGCDTTLTIRPYERNKDRAFIYIDGKKISTVNEEDLISVSISKTMVSIVNLKNKSFFEVLNEKINKKIYF